MSTGAFFRSFIRHVAHAAIGWMVIAVAIEWIFPGSISPFVNLPFTGFLVLLFSAAVIA